MIIQLDGHGKTLIRRRFIKNGIDTYFNRNNNIFYETSERDDEFDPIENHHMEVSRYNYDISYYNKVNHNDLSYLHLRDKEKKSTTFKEVVSGYKEVYTRGLIDGEFSATIFDVFMFLRMYTGYEYEIIMVRPLDTMDILTIGESTYWGIVGHKGNVLFSSNIKDNAESSYKDKKGVGIKFVIRDKFDNSLEVAKVDAIYQNDFPVGVNFEIDMDSLAAILCNKSRAIYGSNFINDEVIDYINGDTYKEKLVDSLLGIIGIYTNFREISNINQNILKIYFDVAASISLIREIDKTTLIEIISNILREMHKNNNSLIEFIIAGIEASQDKIKEESTKKILHENYFPKTFREEAIYKLQTKYVRTIKKPQE